MPALWRLPLLIVGLSGPKLKQIATVDPLSAPTTKLKLKSDYKAIIA